MKTLFSLLVILGTIFFLSCEEDVQEFPCTEGMILGPVCPFGAGYLGYSVFVSDSVPGAIRHIDALVGGGFIMAVLDLPQSYRDQSRVTVYFTARRATLDEIGNPDPRTANCVQPPLFVIEKMKSSCTPRASD